MTVTSAAERRKKRNEAIEIIFPEYGDVVAIKPMDAAFFLRQGMVPDFLAATVNELIATGTTKLPTPEKNEEWLTFLDDLVRFAYVNPKVVDSPQGDDEISIEEVGYTDKVFLYGWFAQPANILRAFRDQQIKLVADVDAAKANGHLTEQVSANN